MLIEDPLVRAYESIVPDVAAFSRAIRLPLPTTFWVNPLKISRAQCLDYFKHIGASVTPLPWHPLAFRWSHDTVLGRHWTFLAGLVHIQEAVSMLPVMVLDPKPGEHVLDLCAAPGNKTAQIAIAMQNRGTVVANDRDYGRMRAFGQIQKRLGLINVSTTICDGVRFPDRDNTFDKVLVDAPCSCEGTVRKRTEKKFTPNVGHSRRLAQVQVQLLKKAIQLCRPGGSIVYSTCTFSPEENEAVIDHILKTQGEALSIEPISLPDFTFSPGITHWAGRDFDPRVINTVRIWPHQNDTGGFFMALLHKRETQAPVPRPMRLDFSSDAFAPYLKQLVSRFAFDPACFEGYDFVPSAKGFYLVNQDQLSRTGCLPSSFVDASGLFFLKTKIQFPKLSTAAAMLFGAHAHKNTIALTFEQFQAYLAQEDAALTPCQILNCTGTGYVLVFYASVCVGMGLLFEARNDRPDMLRSLYPNYLQQNHGSF